MRQYEFLAADIAAFSQRLGKTLTVPRIWYGPACKFEQGCKQINMIMLGLKTTALYHSRPLHDHRNPRRDLIRSLMISVDVHLTEILAMIGTDDHGGLIANIQVSKQVH